ncbi:MAG: RibD family protein [Actinobacteria bacterium]|nr:RibD family protein [Actinomycetota bacterium]
MAERPYTLLSCCVSLDGYLDTATGARLVLSNAADLDRVDEVRAGCDAILVGAETVRSDNPRLLVRDEQRQSARLARGLRASPAKVTITRRAELSPSANFFTTGDVDKLVYCSSPVATLARERFGSMATIVDSGECVHLRGVCEDLRERGVDRLMVEGGGTIHTQFLTEDLADELHIVIAPMFVGDSRAKRFVGDGAFPWNPGRRAELVEVRSIGDVVLARYALSPRFRPS